MAERRELFREGESPERFNNWAHATPYFHMDGSQTQRALPRKSLLALEGVPAMLAELLWLSLPAEENPTFVGGCVGDPPGDTWVCVGGVGKREDVGEREDTKRDNLNGREEAASRETQKRLSSEA